MAQRRTDARRQLDRRYARLRPLSAERPPHRGWIRAIRDALGMSGSELAARMGVTQSTVVDLEVSEVNGTIRLETLKRVAGALDCEVAYFLIPRTSLDEMVLSRARLKAGQHLETVAHHSRLENQEVGDDDVADELVTLSASLVDRRGLWSDW